MVVHYYFLTLALYLVYASVPFWNISKANTVLLCCFLSLCGGLLWGLIQIKTNKSNISQAGLIFDAIITLAFFLTPIFIHPQDLSPKNILGACILVLGIVLLKV